jgi:hypothetical protein
LIDTVMEWVTLYGLKVLGAIAILIIGRIVAKVLRNFVSKAMEKGKALLGVMDRPVRVRGRSESGCGDQ